MLLSLYQFVTNWLIWCGIEFVRRKSFKLYAQNPMYMSEFINIYFLSWFIGVSIWISNYYSIVSLGLTNYVNRLIYMYQKKIIHALQWIANVLSLSECWGLRFIGLSIWVSNYCNFMLISFSKFDKLVAVTY